MTGFRTQLVVIRQVNGLLGLLNGQTMENFPR